MITCPECKGTTWNHYFGAFIRCEGCGRIENYNMIVSSKKNAAYNRANTVITFLWCAVVIGWIVFMFAATSSTGG